MNGDPSTGVVVQTLDAEKFDNGRVLAKSDPVEIKISETEFPAPLRSPESPYSVLESKLADIGAKLLTDAIVKQHYDPNIQNSLPIIETGEESVHAPKLSKAMSNIKFNEMSARDVFRLSLVHDHLYSYTQRFSYTHKKENSGEPRRTIMSQFRLPTPEEYKEHLWTPGEKPQWVYIPGTKGVSKVGSLALRVTGQDWVCFKYITVEGKGRRDALSWTSVNPGRVRFINETRQLLCKPKTLRKGAVEEGIEFDLDELRSS
ncbi:hypothetical protein ABW20_dc0100627 [Dactylellina cionopaga]|nr:hypothetical protein ABW20_dc0100627 [Dactylellina cionopaga]